MSFESFCQLGLLGTLDSLDRELGGTIAMAVRRLIDSPVALVGSFPDNV